ncbi:MAG TPA: glutathione S-transferase family protein [Polyangiaceae bacterium]|nr:glutathione S-transferase family protein [Polyangiaceae bacterium]
MALTLYSLSGSPYGWRVWLALEHKGIAYEQKFLSFDAGDFRGPELASLNPRRRVPVIVDEGFALYESAAIVEYLEDKHPGEPRLFSADPRTRALERRLIREADQYLAEGLERLVDAILFTPKEKWSEETIASVEADVRKELALWETLIGGDYLAGSLSAADFTLFPEVALLRRMATRKVGLLADAFGTRITAWIQRMEALPIVERTWPPHWRG